MMGESKLERNEIFFMTVMVVQESRHFRFLNPIERAGSGIGKSHPFVRSTPSFRPDLRTASAVAHSGGQGWPVFGPPRQRRAASLTAASTTAGSIASGASRRTHRTWGKKSAHEQLKKLLMLTCRIFPVVCAGSRRRGRGGARCGRGGRGRHRRLSDRLIALGLVGMAKAFEEQRQQPV